MTVPNTSIQSGPYAPNGVTTTFPFSFRAVDKDDVEVFRVAGDGTETVISSAFYNVTLTPNGGAVIFAAAPAAGNPLYVRMSPSFRQEISLENEGAFLPEVITEALDRSAQRSLWLRDRAARSLRVPFGEAGFELPIASQRRGGKILGFNGATGAFEVQGGGAFKGDPGGNAMAIGAFSAASGLNIPNGTDLVQTSGFLDRGKGQARYVYDPAVDAAFVNNYPRMSFLSANGRGFRLAEPNVNVQMFGAKGDGVTDDWAALQEILIYMYYYGIRSLFFPQGTYCISKTLNVFTTVSCAQFLGATAYDGVAGPLNFTLFTALKWIGAADESMPMVSFDRSSGTLWQGISLNCDYKAGYGIQFRSSTPADGSVKNIVQNCSIHYAVRDGIIIGDEGVPTAPPAGRQFFGNVFRNLTMYGCQRSAIHINEWNADQQLFDDVMVYHDDNPNEAARVKCDNAFWFDHGGQWSQFINCQVGGMDVQAGKPWSGYMIRNKGSDNGQSGAFGLLVENCWQEGAGGLYYGVTSTSDSKGFVFVHCASFTSNPANPSVYIDKGTSDPIGYTFTGCTLLSDIVIGTPAVQKRDLLLLNNTFATGKGVIDASGRRIIDGVYTDTNVTTGSMVIPRLVETYFVTIASVIGIAYAEGVSKVGDRLKLVVTQDATGGRTIAWGASGNFSSLPPIPQPTAAAGAKSSYEFVSDGTKYYLTSFVG